MEHLYVSKEVTDIVNLAEAEVKTEFDKINKLCEINTMKVLEAFQTNQVSEVHFNELGFSRIPITSSIVSYGLPLMLNNVSPGLNSPNNVTFNA